MLTPASSASVANMGDRSLAETYTLVGTPTKGITLSPAQAADLTSATVSVWCGVAITQVADEILYRANGLCAS